MVLSLIARVFDPIGFVFPFTVCVKFLFQDVWRLGIQWDEELPESLQAGFRKWLDGLSLLEKIAIPHKYFHPPKSDCVDNIELHAFGDASLKGYGACVYLRHQADSGLAKCPILC